MLSIRSSCRSLISFFTQLFQRNSGMPVKEMPYDKTLPSVMICGLGNLDIPDTRHSVGMKAVDYLATKLGSPWIKRSDFKAYIAIKTLEVGPNDLSSLGNGVLVEGEVKKPNHSINMVLLKSTRPMNLNGKSILKAAEYFDTKPENIFLIQDELDKPVGKFSIKEGGSARGHNGVRSVADCFQTNIMCRLLIGIDRPADKSDVANYVLSCWDTEERELVERQMENCLKLLLERVENNLGKQCGVRLTGVVS